MKYLKKRIRLLKEIRTHGKRDALTRVCRRVYSLNGNTMPIVYEFKDRGFVEIRKVKHICYSSVTKRGEELIEMLTKMEELWNGNIE